MVTGWIAFAAEVDAVEVAAVAMLLEVACCKSSDGISGTGFLLMVRMFDALDLAMEVVIVDDAVGPRQTLSWLHAGDISATAADMLRFQRTVVRNEVRSLAVVDRQIRVMGDDEDGVVAIERWTGGQILRKVKLRPGR